MDDPPPPAEGADASGSRDLPPSLNGGARSNNATDHRAGGPLFGRELSATVSESPVLDAPGLPGAVGADGAADISHGPSMASSPRAHGSENDAPRHEELAAPPRVHHPDLPFLVTHWISRYAPPPPSTTANIMSGGGGDLTAGGVRSNSASEAGAISSGARGPGATAAGPNDGASAVRAAPKSNIEEREEALKVVRESAERLARAFQTLGAFGPSAAAVAAGHQLGNGGDPRGAPASYADVARQYAPLLCQGGPTLGPGENGAGGGRASLLDALVSSSTSARTVAQKSEWTHRLPRSLLAAAEEGSVPTASEVEMAQRGSNLGGAAGGAAVGAPNHGPSHPAGSPTNGTPEGANPGGAGNEGPGRIVGNATHNASLDHLVLGGDGPGSALQPPVFLGDGLGGGPETDGAGGANAALAVAARASKRMLEAREEVGERRREVEGALRAAAAARAAAAGSEGAALGFAGSAVAAGSVPNGGLAIDPTGAAEDAASPRAHEPADLDGRRVLAHLGQRLRELRLKQSLAQSRLAEAQREAAEARLRMDGQRGRGAGSIGPPGGLPAILGGSAGGGRRRHAAGLAAVAGRQCIHGSSPAQSQLAVLRSRLSHAVTISAHLIYPVYCLKFDKSGRYFLTGADDQVVKLFCLGVGPRKGGPARAASHSGSSAMMGANDNAGSSAFNCHANARGAVLVTTLRGHAGVVSDMDVSADNALVATASMDGDVRLWGLRDGIPVAILRGHGEANMVSWSVLVPWRLASVGEDGMARVWDVRGAAVRECGAGVTGWAKCGEGGRGAGAEEGGDEAAEGEGRDEGAPEIARDAVGLGDPAGAGLGGAPAVNGAGGNEIGNNGAGGSEGGNNHPFAVAVGHAPAPNNPFAPDELAIDPAPPAPGAFVANSHRDEGVTLLAQCQHGDPPTDGLQGQRSTRAARKTVKVLCLARCPLGGHFATGTDDGVGHIWADDDDEEAGRADMERGGVAPEDDVAGPPAASSGRGSHVRRSGRTTNAPSKERLLATLRGHSHPVTDMQYSTVGDRLLTASMKEGTVCVWSWGTEGSAGQPARSPGVHAKFAQLSRLTLDLAPAAGGGAPRTKGARPDAPVVHCDGAAWTCDDLKVITSQSSPMKAAGNAIQEIVPGSQMLYVWDSRSGRCLMGITGSHTSLCSAVAPHPSLPTVVATAGADGAIHVWDLARGALLLPRQYIGARAGRSGDQQRAAFSPDGLYLVATDENGRVTILDTLRQAARPSSSAAADTSAIDPPEWMKEQYFAHDYYDLLYDPTTGRCVERGSELPPHLAPRGVRCTHEGVAHPEGAREVYRGLGGPEPLPPNAVRWERDCMRIRGAQVRTEGGLISQNGRRGSRTVRAPGLAMGSTTTALLAPSGGLLPHQKRSAPRTAGPRPPGAAANRNRGPRHVRTLSNRYDWRDAYADPESDRDDDADDEDFDLRHARPSRSRDDDDLDDESGDEDEDEDGESPYPRRRGSRGGRRPADAAPGPTRASSRQISRRAYDEVDSDDDELHEMMSTHVTPSGEWAADWTVARHAFRLPRGAGGRVQRRWVGRTSREGNRSGRRTFCPQVGDSVVYIPRAHHDVLQKFPIPGYSPPWASWPTHSPWPVVRCQVTRVRYRFPFEMHYRSRRDKLEGVAAIVTLEITGVPLRADRALPWPEAAFISPVASRTRACDAGEFEVTVFQCNLDDFIVPEFLYTWRLQELEGAIAANGGRIKGLAAAVFCPPEAEEDPVEDAEYVEYTARLEKTNETGEDELHLMASGVGAVGLKWEDADGALSANVAVYNVWEVSLRDREVPAAPAMSEEAKKEVGAAIRTVTNMDDEVRELFWDPVDTSVYTDYMDMVEVPMTLSFIQKRLRCNYYTNKLSVLSDMWLIKENCYKYNEDDNEFYDLACRMYGEFKCLVDAIEEPEVASAPARSSASASAAVGGSRTTGAAARAGLQDLEPREDPSAEPGSPGRRTSPRARAARRQRDEESEEEENGDDGSEEEVLPSRSTRATARSNGRRASSRARGGKSYAEEESDVEQESSEDESKEARGESSSEEEHNDVDDDESDEEEARPSRQSQRKAPSIRLRASSRSRKGPSYQEVDSDADEYQEESSEEASEESSDDETARGKRKKGQAANGGSQRKKRRTAASRAFPDLERWPPVSRRKIVKLGTAMLARLRELDFNELFTRPVAEAYPEVEDAYRELIDTPMDFRTIEEERLPHYGCINELREDLILVFRNCCVFNEDNDEYYDYSLGIWRQLNDIFDEANNARLSY
ncbi:hypothetical protein ACHAXT_001331 [Thalassiosira profunda]